jgi:hypothetical protein
MQEKRKQMAAFSTAGQNIKQFSGRQGIYDELHSFSTLPLT